jgi:peptidoglycan/xylan/chitin deacetylase (PgdA/CDA1 family)
MAISIALLALLFAVDAAAPVDADNADADNTPPAAVATMPTSALAGPTAAIAIAGVTTREPVVALTFDACATRKQANGFDRRIFEILAKEQIPATFYLTGRWVEKHPSAAKLIAAAPWIELGNHTYTHPRLTLTRKERIQQQIRRTNQIIEKTIGRPALTLRPPAGAFNATVVELANQEHLPVVLWSIVSGDAGGHVPASRINRAVLDQAKPGSIIIFHINKRAPFTKKALPDIIAGLREKGFHFVTVSQLLALPDAVTIKAKPSRFGYRPRNKPHPAEPTPPGEDHANPPT